MSDVTIVYQVTHDGGETWAPVRLTGAVADVLTANEIMWADDGEDTDGAA